MKKFLTVAAGCLFSVCAAHADAGLLAEDCETDRLFDPQDLNAIQHLLDDAIEREDADCTNAIALHLKDILDGGQSYDEIAMSNLIDTLAADTETVAPAAGIDTIATTINYGVGTQLNVPLENPNLLSNN